MKKQEPDEHILKMKASWPRFEDYPLRMYSSIVQEASQNQPSTRKRWLKRFGVAGFLFFLIKGLLWLIVPAVIAYFSLW